MGVPVTNRRPHVPGQRPAYAPAGAETGRAAPHPIPRSPPHLRDDGAPERRGRENGQQYARSLLRGLYAGHLRPRHHRRPTQSRPDHGEYPIPCGIDLSVVRSRWGQRLGQKKATPPNSNLRKAKVLEIRRFRGLLVRREGFEPPAFWSVGCLTHKSESFRLRFVLFTAVRSADFPLFPPGPARFFRILGQKWVRSHIAQTDRV